MGSSRTTLVLPSWHDAEDIFQQTSLILWQKWEQFDRSQDFLRWACGIARNEVRNFHRRHAGRRAVFSDELINQLADVRLDAQPALEERRSLLAKCAELLDFTARKLLERCYRDRSSMKAVARQFHLTPNAVYLRLRRIRRELMECIQRGMEGEQRHESRAHHAACGRQRTGAAGRVRCDGTIAPAECGRLESLLTHDRAAQLYYVAYMDLHVQVRWLMRGRAATEETAEETEKAMEEMSEEAGFCPDATEPRASLWTLLSWPSLTASYTVAVLILCGGILAAWTWKSPSGPADRAAGPATIEVVENVQPTAEPRIPVGRITRTVACRWTNMMFTKETSAKDLLTVFLGSRYIVDAGLLEITYQSGAKVVLRGPTVYEIDGRNGGFLHFGAATVFCKSLAQENSGATEKKGAMAANRSADSTGRNSSAFTLLARALWARQRSNFRK